jgi:hypothetical protein
MLVVEPVFRIVIEAYRADERGYVVQFPVASIPAWLPPGFSSAGADVAGAIVGLTTSQFIGLALMIVGAIILVVRRRRGVAPEVPLEEEL